MTDLEHLEQTEQTERTADQSIMSSDVADPKSFRGDLWTKLSCRTMFRGMLVLVALLPSRWLRADELAEATQRAAAATVAVEARLDIQPNDSFPEDELRLPGSQKEKVANVEWSLNLCSGTIVSADGLVVTLAVDGPFEQDAQVILSDGREFSAKVVMIDERSKLQLLQIDTDEKLPFLPVAEELPGLGTPIAATWAWGPDSRMAGRGIVAGLDLSVPTANWGGLLGTDIAVGGTSAGGPLVDANGHLIGIVIAKRALHFQHDTATFAVAAPAIRGLLKTPRREGDPTRIQAGYLGVTLIGKDKVTVKEVLSGSPADKAGIRPDDEIQEVDAQKVKNGADVQRAIKAHAAGDQVKLTVTREGTSREVTVVLAAAPPTLYRALTLPRDADESAQRALELGLPSIPRVFQSREDTEQAPLREDPPAILLPLPTTKRSGESALPHKIILQRNDFEKEMKQMRDQIEQLKKQNAILIDKLDALLEKDR